MSEALLRKIISNSYAQRSPLMCTMELTTACSFRCVHCYIPDVARSTYLSKDDAISFIDNVVSKGCLYIVFTGGDPLLHPDFPFIYKHARKSCNVIVFTNGYAFNNETMDLFTAIPPSKIEITIYGASNDTYEKTVGVRAYSIVMNTVQELVLRKIPLKLKAFLVNENFFDWHRIQKLARDFDLELKVDSFIVASHDSGLYTHQLPLERQIELMRRYKNVKKSNQCKELQSLIDKRGPEKMYHCGAGMYSAWLRADNTLNMCAFTPACKAISLNTASFTEAWDKLGIEADSDMPESLKCRTCTKEKECFIYPTKYMAINGDGAVTCLPLCSLLTEKRG